ncbi:hypothetical protein [Hymenobacter terricola]|nr:hypothetical protein [Hymenobacter terricola]
MKHVFLFSTKQLLRFTRRGALLLALGAAGPASRSKPRGWRPACTPCG